MDSDSDQAMDIHKMKVPDLKRELKAKGLSTTGNKNELIERLQNALKSKMDDVAGDSTVDDLDEDLLNDDDDEHLDGSESGITDLDTIDIPEKGQKRRSEEMSDNKPAKKVVLNRTSSNSESVARINLTTADPVADDPKDEEKKVVKLSELTAKERLEMRAKKFGVTITGDAKKAARAERFGAAGNNTETQSSSTVSATPNLDTLKQRAERFGLPATTAISNLDKEERLKRRQERFGTAPANGTADTSKLQQRLDRFKQTVK